MKSYIIRLIEFNNSVKWANDTFNSAKKHNWDINYFEGINGLKYSLDNFNIKPNLKFKKGARYLEKPGVVGCFLSHYSLWKESISLNESVCILEHDATVISKFPQIQITDVLKFVKGTDTKPMYIGKWWASAAAYCVTPQGAKKLVDFTHTVGAMPADIMINTGIVDIKFYKNIVNVNQNEYSFTRNLKK